MLQGTCPHVMTVEWLVVMSCVHTQLSVPIAMQDIPESRNRPSKVLPLMRFLSSPTTVGKSSSWTKI